MKDGNQANQNLVHCSSLEIGIAHSIELGPVNGEMAAFLSLQICNDGSSASLGGTLKVRGRLSVLGLMTTSVAMNIEFQARIDETMTIPADIDFKVRICMDLFSVKQCIEVSKQGTVTIELLEFQDLVTHIHAIPFPAHLLEELELPETA